MPSDNLNSAIFSSSKNKMKEVEIILDPNDDVLASIKLVMKQQNITKATVSLFEGNLMSLSVNYFENGTLKNVKYFEPHEVIKGTGELRYDFVKNFIIGRIRILYKHKGKSFDGVLMSGKAKSGFKINLTYLEESE